MAKQQAVVKKGGKVRKKVARNIPVGIAHVRATFIIQLSPSLILQETLFSWASAGKVGYSGSKNLPPSQRLSPHKMLLKPRRYGNERS